MPLRHEAIADFFQDLLKQGLKTIAPHQRVNTQTVWIGRGFFKPCLAPVARLSLHFFFAADLLPRLPHQARLEILKTLLLIIQAGLALFGQISC